MLVSFFLASHRPDQFMGLLDNLEKTAAEKTCFEVIVIVDDDDKTMHEVIAKEKSRRPFVIKHHTIANTGFFNLWKSFNDILPLIDEKAYFINNLNDKVRFTTAGWDNTLKKYIGFFKDDIFRLRMSRFRLRNYFDIWECWYAPDNFAFYSRRWIEIQGDFNACHASDAFQQCVAYYLMRANYPDALQISRDVPVWGIDIAPQESGDTLSPEALEKRNAAADKAWYTIMGVKMQTEIFRRARLLQGHIAAAEYGFTGKPAITDDKKNRLLEFRFGEEEMPRLVYSYRVDAWRIRWRLFMERLRGGRFHYLRGLQQINRLGFYKSKPQERYPDRVFHNTR